MRANPTQRRSRETVSAALAAANEEFAEHGFHSAQMTRIARRAEVSVGALYRFFPDKQSLAKALADDYGEQVEQRYGEVLADVARPEQLVPAVRQIIRVACELQREHPGYYRLTSDVNPSHDESWGHAVRAGLIQQFASGLKAIGVDNPDGERVIEFAIEVTRATLATLPVSGPRRDEVLDELEEMIAIYLAARLNLPNPDGRPAEPLARGLPRIEVDPEHVDWHELHSLVTAAYASMHGRIDPPSSLIAMTPADFEHKAADEHLIVASVDGRLVGCVFCWPQDDWLYIGKLAVTPALQRSGVGRLLIDAARSFAEEAGLDGLELDTRIELTENHRAFDRLGFVKVAELSHPGYTTVTSIRMRRPTTLGPEST